MTKNGKRDLNKDLMIAAAAIVVGITISGFAAADLLGHKVQLAQATQPLQSTPGADSKPSTSGTSGKGTDMAPEPARPDADAQKAGAAPVLPPAPAEKTAAPIPAR